MPSSDELLDLANRCASKLELDGVLRHVPSFSDVEQVCDDEYEELLQAIHEDELFAPVDIGRQEQLVEQIAAALPEARFVHVIREDPVRRGLLYLGTENGLYVSFDDGAAWQPLQTNLPHAPVYWMVIQEHFNDLVISTYGRGFWILDDLSIVRGISASV